MRTRGKRAQVFLGDRPIGITLQRTFARLSLLDKVRLAYTLLREPWDIPEQEIEKLKVRPPCRAVGTPLSMPDLSCRARTCSTS
jgi:pheromone shutdown protein TraB